MKPDARHRWILAYLKEEPGGSLDVLNRDFVDAYAEATGAKVKIQPYGANGCPQLGRDLLEMKRSCYLQRKRVGIEGMAGMGFPRWVWSYRPYKSLVFDDAAPAA